MDVRPSPEQQALRDAAARLVDRLGPHAVVHLDDAERAAKLDAAIAAAGWRELRAESDTGGPVASGVEAAILAEELSRGLADAPFVGPTLAVELRRLAELPEASSTETVVLDAALGDAGAAVDDHTAPGVAIDAGTATTALLLIPGTDGHGVGQIALTKDRTRVDLTRPSADVRAGVDVQRLHASRTIADDELMTWTALGLALTSADLVGAMQGALALSCDYAQARRQYGAPIGSFQAVQHLLADALVSTEGSRSAALYAAWAVDALAPADALAAAAVAKAYCSRAARTVCETAIQVHGGIGNTWECLAHVYLRRALLSIDAFGGAGASLARVLAHEGIGGTRGLH